MNRQNAKKFHPVGSTTFDMQVTRSEVDRRTVEPRLTTTPFIRTPRSLLRPYSFKPKVKTIESFYYFEDPVNATTS